jgi:hypothetical protein
MCTRVCNNQLGTFGGRVCKEPARETKKLKGALLLCTLVELRFEGKSEFYGRDPTYGMDEVWYVFEEESEWDWSLNHQIEKLSTQPIRVF